MTFDLVLHRVTVTLRRSWTSCDLPQEGQSLARVGVQHPGAVSSVGTTLGAKGAPVEGKVTVSVAKTRRISMATVVKEGHWTEIRDRYEG